MCRTGEWNKSYIWPGEKEIKEHLSVTNTILNVSSVMWKKQDYTEILEKAGEFKVAGDWYIYFNILKMERLVGVISHLTIIENMVHQYVQM